MIFYLRKKYSETEKDKELIEYAMEMQPAISLLVSVSLLWPWLSPTRFPSCFVGGCSDFLLLPGAFTVLPVKSPTGVWQMRPCHTHHPTVAWQGCSTELEMREFSLHHTQILKLALLKQSLDPAREAAVLNLPELCWALLVVQDQRNRSRQIFKSPYLYVGRNKHLVLPSFHILSCFR